MAKKRTLPTELAFTTWEEFCKLTGTDPVASLPNVSSLDEENACRVIADHKLAAMTLYCNGGTLPDYDDDEWKHEIWWRVIKDKTKPSGRGLSYDDCDFWTTRTSVGPRFAFYDEDHAKHMAKHFLAEYEAKYL